MSTPFRVLISDSMSSRAQEILSACSLVEVDVKPNISAEELAECIGNYNGLLVRSRTQVTEAILQRATQLKVIGRAGIGVDNIDVEAASRLGIIVENAPNGNAVTTAEHAICLLLSMVRNIPSATASLKDNRWEKKKLQGTELCDKVFGVMGLGNIGKIVADRARGLRMRVVAFDPFISNEAASQLGIELLSLDDLLAKADFISIHTPLTKDTHGLIGAHEFAKMKDGVFLVNAARGGIVDEEACVAALNSGKLAGAAFDVFVKEPVPADHPLVMHPKVVCSPHLGASTGEAQVKVAIEVAEQMVDYAEDGVIRNALNAAPVTGEMRVKLTPWLDLSNRLGSLLGQLLGRSGHAAQSLEVEVTGEAGDQGVNGCVEQALVGLLSALVDEHVNDVNARLVADERGLKVSETKVSKGRDLSAGIRVVAKHSEGEHAVVGTLYHMNDEIEARVVQIDGFLVELAPHGNIVVVQNQDKPGVIGAVGSVIGERGINVNNLHVAHDKKRGRALALWSISTELDDNTMDKLRSLSLIESVNLVRLGN